MASENSENSSILDVADVLGLPSVALDARKSLPQVGGVYFVYAATGAVLYVGSSKNLRTRWNIHHRQHRFAEIPGVRIAWVLVEQTAQRLALEYQCIATLHPLYQQGDIPVRQNKHGQRRWCISLDVSEEVYRHLQNASQDYYRSLPQQVIFILKRIIQSGQLDKWSKQPNESSSKGNARLWRGRPSPQISLFSDKDPTP